MEVGFRKKLEYGTLNFRGTHSWMGAKWTHASMATPTLQRRETVYFWP